MQYGFLIDHRRCIGCHACTVACKQENDVPVGDFRTWVKYTEKGTFPAVKRHFAVLRCNHCTSAPCVTICPVTALSKRKDGIVDIDRDACIGCRACMQACPYDAIYLNEDSGAVEKCHFCAHRVERGLEPACVVVCPEGAIIPGDLHDPKSKIATMVREHDTLVRRPEQKTGPNVHYLGCEPVGLMPGEAARPATFLWSDRPQRKPDPWPMGIPTVPDATTVLDAEHKVQWGWPVALYLVTKGIAAGASMLAPFGAALGLSGFARDWAPELLALVFVSVTTFLLVEDLHRPMKFLTLLTRPNTRSWLVKGAWILIGFSMTVSLTLGLRWFGMDGAADAVRWVSAFLGLGVAGYTAFLFQQCEGRDLWQGPLLLPHLLVQAVLCGAATLLPFQPGARPLFWVFFTASVVHILFVTLELVLPHPTANARQAVGFLKQLRFAGMPAMVLAMAGLGGVLLPVVLNASVLLPWLAPLALVLLYAYEWAYVRAGQLPPLS